MIQPVETSYYAKYYYKTEIDAIVTKLNFTKEDISGKKLYIYSGNILNSKLREAGFTITYSLEKADVIVIYNPAGEDLKAKYTSKENPLYYSLDLNKSVKYFSEDFDRILAKDAIISITPKELYKYIYKYEGNLELFKNIDELFKSGSRDNIKMGMEFMVNANWENNKIYLMELFNLYENRVIRRDPYYNSTSFKGFRNSLDFGYTHISFNQADDYREYCTTEEHHEFVFNKYVDNFKEQLFNLAEKYKISIKEIKYEIDRDKIYEFKTELINENFI